MNDAFDGAIDSPDRDLLGMKVYARQLADLIAREPAPFTIGIYGEWGTGKTSFVQLVSHYLQQGSKAPVIFIPFSAWQYKTADEIWRALLLEIARRLYDMETVAEVPAIAEGALQKLRRALDQDALVVREGPADPLQEKRRKFHELAARLGMFTERIGHAAGASRLDPEALGLTIAKASVVAASAFAPWLGRLRELLGIEAKLKPEQLLRGGELTPERVASTQEFLRLFKELLESTADGRQVCVFVDDLDRCMPDTALDVLEAIKLYLGDARCVFIVAADQQLIAHGLQLRFHGSGAGKDGADVSLAKGREYFEKIIQLGIPVPQRTYEDIHGLISAKFPEWASASDIIHAAVGSNPRRVKQYCTWLSYRHAVVRAYRRASAPRQGPEPASSGSIARQRVHPYELFKKLVELRTWNPDCARALLELAERVPSAAEPDASYSAVMNQVEDALRRRAAGMQDDALRARIEQPATGNAPRKRAEVVPDGELRERAVAMLDAELRGRLNDPHAQKLYGFAVESAPVQELFSDAEEPLLSIEPPERVATLLRLAAVRPARGVSAGSDRDRMLRVNDAVFERIANTTSVTGDAKDLLIGDLTRWISLLRSNALLAERFARLAIQASDGQWNDEVALLEACLDDHRSPDEANLSPEARELWAALRNQPAREFLDPRKPRFSTMLRQEVAAFAKLERPEQLPRLPLSNTWSDEEEGRAVAAAAIESSVPGWNAPDGFAAAVARASTGLQLRIDIADQLLQLRSFAKLDALNSGWPHLGQLVHADRPAIKDLERSAAASKDKDPLQWLLQLRPWFSEIPDALIAQYFQMAQELVASGTAAAAHAEHPTAGERPVRVDDKVRYENVTVDIVPVSDSAHQIELTYNGKPMPRVATQIDLAELELHARELNRWMPDYVARDVVERPDRRALLQSIGTWTYQHVFSGALEDRLQELLKSERNLRIAWKWSSALALLPWETLHVPPVGPFLGLDRRISLVRYHPAGVSGAVRALRPPLRMLVVMTSPRGAPPLNIAREEAMLRDTLGNDPRVKLNFLTGTDATIENVQARLRDFEPQLFHLVAHGFRRPGKATDSLLLSAPDGQGVEVSSSDFAPLLGRTASGRSSVQLAVLNSCDTGKSEYGNAVAGIAGEMVVSGLPAVIATTRRVLDPSAILFAREFYRAYLGGHPLEAALVEARLALNANDWDWSAYTLLTGIPDLDHFTLGPLPVQRGGRAAAPAARQDDPFATTR